jgi:hypothetical protein
LLRHIWPSHFPVRRRTRRPGKVPDFDHPTPCQFPSQGSKRTDFTMVPKARELFGLA